jgi:DHA1 family tetracycline resistance protein-like MFS transporter/uncharacterized oxidoreductase
MQFSGNKVLVTGASSGIGYALTRHFLRQGNEAVAVGRQLGRLPELRTEYPLALHPVAGDLTQRRPLDDLVGRPEQQHPTLNGLADNAAGRHNYDRLHGQNGAFGTGHEIPLHLTVPLQLVGRPELAAQPQAAIVGVSSGLAFPPEQAAPVYCATKARLHVFTRALRYQLEHTRVQVLEIIPWCTRPWRWAAPPNSSPEAWVEEFWRAFTHGQWEGNLGKGQLLCRLLRLAPGVATRLMKPY